MNILVDPCKRIRVLLALRREDWSDRERQQVASHVASCESCAALARAYAEQEQLLQRTAAAQTGHPQWLSLHQCVEQQRRWNSMKARWNAVLSSLLALVAIAVLVLGLIPLFERNRQTQPGPATDAPTVAPTMTATPASTPTTQPTATSLPLPTPTTQPTMTSLPLPTPTTAPPTSMPSRTPVVVPATGGLGIEIAPGSDPDKVIRLVQDLGLGWVKRQVSWSEIEPSKGEYVWGALDALVEACAAADLQVLFSVIEAPAWTRDGEPGIGPPKDPQDLGDLMRAMAARYKSRVTAYEIWHNQNFRSFWEGSPLSAEEYVALLESAYSAIKASDPQAVVISGAPMATGVDDGTYAIQDLTYLQTMYDAGLQEYCDAIGAHPGGYANPPDVRYTGGDFDPRRAAYDDHRVFFFRNTIEDMYQVMVRNDDPDRLMWVTQFGWATVDGMGVEPSPGFEYTAEIDEYEQASYIVRAYEWAMEWGHVGGMFLWNLDMAVALGADDPAAKYSVLYEDGLPRPAYEAIRQRTIPTSPESMPQGSGLFVWPVNGPLSEGFGDGHGGLDIAAPAGTSVHAADAGLVSVAGPGGAYGNVVIIDHLNGLRTVYAHLDEVLTAAGEVLPKGTILGTVGETGTARGPHLHFEIRERGACVDPEIYLP